MTGPTQQLNKIPADPQLKDLLDLFKKDIFLSLNCHAVGTIKSFDALKQSASITINYNRTFFTATQNQTLTPQYKDYPPLLDVPLINLFGGPAGLTLPIAAGDTCLIFFNDRSLDNWLQSGQSGPVANSMLHAFTDAIALVGLRSFNMALAAYDTQRALLYNGQTKVGVGASKVLVTNAALISLGSSLDTLLTQLNSLMTQLQAGFNTPTPAPGTPVNAAVATAIGVIQTSVATVKTNLQGLLE